MLHTMLQRFLPTLHSNLLFPFFRCIAARPFHEPPHICGPFPQSIRYTWRSAVPPFLLFIGQEGHLRSKRMENDTLPPVVRAHWHGQHQERLTHAKTRSASTSCLAQAAALSASSLGMVAVDGDAAFHLLAYGLMRCTDCSASTMGLSLD